MTPMTTDARARRRRAWILLSELFVDTEGHTPNVRRIAHDLIQTGFDVHELEHIWEDEVAPAFDSGLLGLWGPWPDVDPAWIEEGRLVARIERILASPWSRWERRLRRRAMTRETRSMWDAIRREIESPVPSRNGN
jgi:hypothetical protein